MNVPKSILKYVLYQRTVLDRGTFLFDFFSKVVFKLPVLNKLLIPIRVFLHENFIRERYVESMKAELESLQLDSFRPYRHEGVAQSIDILDIGAGVGGIDVLLYKMFANKGVPASISLVDKTLIDSKVWYGFKEKGSFYNSFAAAELLMRANSIPESHVHFFEPDEFISKNPQADLVISLISWGYHYPVSTYIATVKKSLRPGGVLIIDVRDPDGQRELEEVFGKAELLNTDTHRNRLKFQLPA